MKEFKYKSKIIMTLGLIIVDNQILLGLKKRGFGQGLWNGFGGKVEPGETLKQSLIREFQEECEITPTNLTKRAIMRFHFPNNNELLEGHLYTGTSFIGKPKETEEMKPCWYDLDKIPFKQMWPDDILWFPYILQGKNFEADFWFKDQNSISQYEIKEN